MSKLSRYNRSLTTAKSFARFEALPRWEVSFIGQSDQATGEVTTIITRAKTEQAANRNILKAWKVSQILSTTLYSL